MDKRFLLFLILAFLVLTTNALVNSLFQKPRPPVAAGKLDPAAKAAAKAAADKSGAGKSGDKQGDKQGDEQGDEQGPDAKQPDTDAAGDEPAADAAVVAAEDGAEMPAADDAAAPAEGEKIAPRRVSLGSYDPATGYRLLVTLNNQGAAVERIELNSPRYRELEDRSGYLGHVTPATDSKGGAIVRVVGRGTPAAQAGLEADDVIKTFNGTKIFTALDLEEALKTTEAGDEVELAVERHAKPLTLKARLARRPLEIVRPEYESKALEVVGNKHDPFSLLFTFEQLGAKKLSADEEEFSGLNLRDGEWEVAKTEEGEVVFRRLLPKLNLEVLKRYRLAKAQADVDTPDAPEYHLLVDLEVHNLGKTDQVVAYRFDGPTGLPLEGSWYAKKISRTWGGAGMRDIIQRTAGNQPNQDSCLLIADAKPEEPITHPLGRNESLDYVAVDAQFFAAALIPRKSKPTDVWFDQVESIRVGAVPADKKDKKLTNVSFRLTSVPLEVPAGAGLTHRYQLFAGPKKPALLDQYVVNDANLGELVYYGWVGWVAKPMLGLLHFFYSIVQNYGLAIIMLTVMVRGCMFPLSRKQALSAQKMQELKPEIQRINEKYKAADQRAKAMQELYRKHSFSPFGGCLPMFVQLPIFIGLYRSLSVDVELRQASLFGEAVRWCSNLAAPDMLWDWSKTMPAFVTGYLGPFLNVFPLFTIALFIWQQKMFMPPPTDEQTAMQQKMMSYMMLFMGVMFYDVAAGLCLYFIASSLWGIAERKLLPKPATPPGTPAVATNSGSTGGNGAPSGKKKQPGRK